MKDLSKLTILKDAIRNVPDFPKKGVQFKDITTAIKQYPVFSFIIDSIAEYYADKEISKVVAIESRGFITGGALAYKLGAGFIPVRKPGKLPAERYAHTYKLEYGEDTLEIHKDALSGEDVVLLHDDVLATGGTALAATELIKHFDVKSIYVNFIIELGFLEGRKCLSPHYELFSLIQY